MSVAKAFRAAVFDMDGVLVDSERHHRAAWCRLCLEEGVMLTEDEVSERTLGRPVRESLPVLMGRSLGPDEASRFMRRKAALYEEVSQGKVSGVPGVVRFVHALGAAGVPRARRRGCRDADRMIENNAPRGAL
jgi:beta-phosphoglucomutase-like phosphatase (HAD superfamily)